ncbi:MAG: hypothetical protein QM770_18150 [Tepidisphaeraceae bacterium]
MANGYMPRGDLDALTWMKNYAARLLARPADYFVTPDEADALRAAVQTFDDALRLAIEPSTRTASAIASKDAARATADGACRVLYNRIKADTRVEATAKINAGVRPANPRRTHIGPPDSAPVLSLRAIHTDGHTIGCKDAQHEGHAKPFGATQLQLYRTTVGGDLARAELVGCYTRVPIRVTCPPSLHGTTAVYRARWMTRRGETGPWSNALTAPVVSTAPQMNAGVAA